MSAVSFTKGYKNAGKLGDEFTNGQIIAGSVTFTSAEATAVVTHGLNATPTFVLATDSSDTNKPTVSANSTSVTFTRTGTTTAGTIYYMIGVLA